MGRNSERGHADKFPCRRINAGTPRSPRTRRARACCTPAQAKRLRSSVRCQNSRWSPYQGRAPGPFASRAGKNRATPAQDFLRAERHGEIDFVQRPLRPSAAIEPELRVGEPSLARRRRTRERIAQHAQAQAMESRCGSLEVASRIHQLRLQRARSKSCINPIIRLCRSGGSAARRRKKVGRENAAAPRESRRRVPPRSLRASE